MIDQYTPVSVAVAVKCPAKADAVVVFAAVDGEGDSAKSAAFAGQLAPPERAALAALVKARAIPRKANELVMQVIDATTGRRLMVVGVGPRKKVTVQSIREAAGVVAKAARKHKIGSVAILVDPAIPLGTHEIAAACATGLCAGFFLLEQFKGTAERDRPRNRKLSATLVVDAPALKWAQSAAGRAVELAKAQNFARAVAGHPGNVMHPPALAKLASQAAKEVGLAFRVLDEKQMKKLGMGGMIAVGMGSPKTPPRMIVLEWRGKKASSVAPRVSPLLLVGKAITFDTGGISIKPRENMQKMVYDKCGAMAVLGAMIALAKLKAPVHVVGLLAAAENHVSADAYRPGDIIAMYNGVTVEITNTDAEGRLVLADALAWGIETYKPAAVVDLATLTGGVVVALGKEFAGLFSNNDALAQEIAEAGEFAGEKTWRLPIGQEVREMMKSDHADIVNSAGRWAHPIQGAEFLRRAIPEDGKVPWVHLDIAGVADNDKATPLYSPGATGWGVRTLVHWILNRNTLKETR